MGKKKRWRKFIIDTSMQGYQNSETQFGGMQVQLKVT